MPIIKPSTTHLTYDAAVALAADLNTDGADGWTYEVSYRPGDRFARVLAYDDEGELVGPL